MTGFNMKVTPEIEKLTELCKDHTSIDLSLYGKYDVKRGLRDINGKGVLAGLTQVSNVQAVKVVDGKEVPCAGSLYYRGYNIKDLTAGFVRDDRFGFEETTYLLLFGKLPDKNRLEDFKQLLANQRTLPRNFVRDVVMKAPGRDIMNALSRSVLTLYSYDNNPDDISLPNVLRQCLNLISVFPLLSVYGYQAYNHYIRGKSLYIHNPKKELSTAENILRILRPDKKIYRSGGKNPGSCFDPSYGAWRWKQLYFHHSCGVFFRNRYIFSHCCSSWFLERTEAWRCEY